MPCSCGVCQECDWARNHEYEDDAIQSANERISELEAQLAAQHERVIMLEVSYAEKLEALSDANEMLAERDRQLKEAREALKVSLRWLNHHEDGYDWCPRCIVEEALARIEETEVSRG